MTQSSFSFLSKKPSCLKGFRIQEISDVKSNWVTGPEFKCKLVKCQCGNSELKIYASYENGMHLAPIILECTNCDTKEVIFNPEIHGWDGQNGDDCSMVGTGEPELFVEDPTKVVIEYSYQGLENYEELIEDGIGNPEDYFDVFSVYICNDKGELKEVVSYECA